MYGSNTVKVDNGNVSFQLALHRERFKILPVVQEQRPMPYNLIEVFHMQTVFWYKIQDN